MLGGFLLTLDEGCAPSNVQSQLVGPLMLLSVKLMQSLTQRAVSLERKLATGASTLKLLVQLLTSVPATPVYIGKVKAEVFPALSRWVAVIHPSKEPFMVQLPPASAFTVPMKSVPWSGGS